MPSTKLTETVIERTSPPPGKPEVILWDTELSGFGIRIRETARTYIVAYRPAGAGRSANTRKVKVGPYAAFQTVQHARRAAQAILGRVASGADPAAERAEDKRKAKARLSDVLDAYDRDLQRRRYVNRKVVMAGLKARLAGHLHQDINDVSGADLAGIIEKLEDAGRAGAAQDFRSRARAFFAFAVTKAKVAAANPLAGYRREQATRADKVAKAEHGRALTDAELVKVWQAADPATTFGRLVRFLAATGCRRGEAAGLLRSMVKGNEIHLPPAFTKQGRGHIVPVTPIVRAILEACPVDARTPDLVFASPRSGGPVKGWTQLVAKLCEKSGVEFELHDLRRTFRTGLSRLGVDSETAELALGHARTDLEAVYNRDEMRENIRAGFSKWEQHLAALMQQN
jgi:integrase